MSQKRIEKPAMLLAGYTVKASAETTELIQQVWELFMATWQKVDYAKHQNFYVIQAPVIGESQFMYTLAIEVDHFGELPEGMAYTDLAAMEYAWFDVTEFKPENDLYQEIEDILEAEGITFLTDYTLEIYPSTNLSQVQVLAPLHESLQN